MSKRFALLPLLFITLSPFLRGQQFAQYSMPWLDPVQFNPAYAGLDNSLSITGAYRSQWAGLEGQPVGQRVSAHLPVYFLSSGVGIEVERDQIGARQLNSFGLSYNYQLVRGASVWSVGLSARMLQLGLDGSALRTPDGNYEDSNTVIHNDDLLPVGSVDNSSVAFGAGLYYQSESFEGGLSARNLNEAVIAFPGFDYLLQREYHAYLRAKFDILRQWEVFPMIYAVSDGTQFQTTAGATFRFQENIFGGVAYRGYSGTTSDAVIVSGGLNISEKLSLAYAYDITLSNLATVQTGSHEISLKYNLRQRIGAGVPPPLIFYPRAKE
ncbi:type IX secretion system membrane protein PorP/SprF [Neolewinella aurantiaca]|uniref:Type IX secretion system membrane protein PorP/SprF n=1 Tax=Neolewinella aurantiaca TaxID=2602767 RepID=A0A5C7FJG2_9BACT|nr:PorP/SprF family type IX secretion system membrane protein [Neolewinella aurantiaca]TXF86269.1 type IX secretion system membrane protein PorP/SprF [Neolewinella aurantiaca]